MDTTRGLITTLIDTGGLNETKRAGIDQTFLDENYIPVWNYLNKHYSEYKELPSRDAVLRAFPNFEFGSYKEPVGYFVNELKETYRRNVLEEKIEEVARVYTQDTTRAEETLREALKALSVTQKSHRDIELAKLASERYETYVQRKDRPPEDGILTGWPAIDYQTLGAHEEEFIVLVGEKFMGKSWTLIWLAYQALLQGERVLFITKEMSQEAVSRRFDAIYSSIKFDSLRRGELSNVEEKRYKEKLSELEKSNFHFTIARDGVATIEDIKQKAIETDATCVFGDSIYLFLPDSTTRFSGEVNKRLEISRKCKEISRELSIPVTVSVQAGRTNSKVRVPTLDDIEWSNAFSQDADTVIYLHKDDLDKEIGRAQMYLLKARDADLAKCYINQDFDYMKFDQRDEELEPSTEINVDEEETLDFNA